MSNLLTELVPGVWMLRDRPSWTGARSRRTGYVLRLPEAGTIFVDPPPLSEEECAQVEAAGTPAHILLTCNWHLRGSEPLRQRWGCRLWVHEAGVPTAETPIDGTFRHGERLWGAIDVVQLPELGWPEEVALLARSGEGLPSALIVGDALCGGRTDIGLAEGDVGNYSLALGREQAQRYIPDLPAAHAALTRLLALEFDVLAFGHGAPVLQDPHAALRRFLGQEDLWDLEC